MRDAGQTLELWTLSPTDAYPGQGGHLPPRRSPPCPSLAWRLSPLRHRCLPIRKLLKSHTFLVSESYVVKKRDPEPARHAIDLFMIAPYVIQFHWLMLYRVSVVESGAQYR
jgi:hypothetical protein